MRACLVPPRAGKLSSKCHDKPAPQNGFKCDRCPTGYSGDGVHCHDIDDCAGNPCGKNGKCNDIGVRKNKCTCNKGFKHASGKCLAINPCSTKEANSCDKNAICLHTGPGQHICSCMQGWTAHGTSCIDEDGCRAATCFGQGKCLDIKAPGTGYKCSQCPMGYVGNGITCHDIDDCQSSPCGAGHTCIDTGPNVHGCACRPGYLFTAGTCMLHQGCGATAIKCAAHAMCNAFGKGKYTCTCKIGYRGDGYKSCQDVDGCAGHPCSPLVKCHDVSAPGTGAKCDPCPSGYIGDGKKCHDIDDCATQPCGRTYYQFNGCKDLGPDKYSCQCVAGYTFASGTCLKIQSCKGSKAICGNSGLCQKLPNNHTTCVCGTGYSGNGHASCKTSSHRRAACLPHSRAALLSTPPPDALPDCRSVSANLCLQESLQRH